MSLAWHNSEKKMRKCESLRIHWPVLIWGRKKVCIKLLCSYAVKPMENHTTQREKCQCYQSIYPQSDTPNQ